MGFEIQWHQLDPNTLYLAPDIQPHQHANTPFLQLVCSSRRPAATSVKALKGEGLYIRTVDDWLACWTHAP